MTKETQKVLRLPIYFLSFGRIKATLYWLFDGKKRRYYAIPPYNNISKYTKESNFIYGGIYVINDFNEYKRSLYSFYNSSIPYLGESIQEDLYIPKNYTIQPIKFKSLKQIEKQTYDTLDNIEGVVLFGNDENKDIIKNTKNQHKKQAMGIDVANFITMIKEIK